MDPARDPGHRLGSALAAPSSRRARLAEARARLRRALRPPRRLAPPRAGWLFLGLVFAVGFAALNTGNNLLYLVLSLMLAFLVLSGVLSEGALRGIRIDRRLPFDWVAGRPGRVVLEVANAQQRTWSHAIVVEDLGRDPRAATDTTLGRVFAMLVAPGATEPRSYLHVAPARGELRFHGFRVSTRFPFGLFTKSLEIPRDACVVVYPRLTAQRPPRRRHGEVYTSHAAPGRTAPASEVAGLREFTPGDSPRRIHWRATMRRGALLVREQEGAAGAAAEVRLRTRDADTGDAFEREVERAASETESGLRDGLRIALRTDSAQFPPDAGAVHRARLLGYLALVEPDDATRGAR